ncbi:MAG: NAD(P)-dependent oxidoreductase [Lachnospiraceae bacterium]|nr:NAD(P)-dependent oxidoreductase [Lachnospiraceae bacterium]MDE6232708.1 NAD(P)-dependent oxidoreductase [Lachnospiraceae bacterium]MDE6251256.1 NAD(P)-dependent oxidoreductase [Lachnospiraceae bacterium]
MRTAVITGPTGTIGMALIEKLINEGVRIVAVCRPKSERISRIPKHENVRIVECSLKEMDKLPDIIQDGADVFYHFAWDGTFGDTRNDLNLQNNNVKYALDAVKAAKKIGCTKFVGAGSQAEYGRVEGMLKPNTPAFPENGYGIAKLCAGQMTKIMCEQLGLEHIWVRILSIYGPYDGENTMIMSVIGKILSGEKPSLTKGEQMWDYLYSKDVANAFYLVGEKGKNGAVYCIGSGKARPLKEYVERIRDSIDTDAELGIGDIPYREKQVMYLCADIEKLTDDTGFVPEYDFDEGIRETIEWYKKNYG